jgi:hypothetical protein
LEKGLRAFGLLLFALAKRERETCEVSNTAAEEDEEQFHLNGAMALTCMHMTGKSI